MINAALEELIKQRYEMPAFSTLDRLMGRVRTLVYGRIYRMVQRRMTSEIQHGLEALFEVQLPSHRSAQGYSSCYRQAFCCRSSRPGCQRTSGVYPSQASHPACLSHQANADEYAG